MQKTLRSFHYWWELVTSSKETFDKIIWGLTGIVWVFLALIGLADFTSTNWEIVSQPNLDIAAWIIGVILAVRAVFWLTFRKHEEKAASHAREKEQLETSHIEQQAVLKSKIQTLQSQLDDKAKRKKTKDELASCRITIQHLTSQLLDIEYFQYANDTRQNFERDYLEMANTTHLFLEDKVGRSEAASFSDSHAIPKVIIPSNVQFDTNFFKDRWVEKQFMLNRLKYQSEQLKDVESKLDSKDFIMP
jgi:hypothetical protein